MSIPFGRRSFAFLVAVMTLLLISVNAVYAESRPFGMSLQGNANPTPVDNCTLTNTETGTGTALHLGALTWVSNEVVNLCAEGGPQVTAAFILTAASASRCSVVFERQRGSTSRRTR